MAMKLQYITPLLAAGAAAIAIAAAPTAFAADQHSCSGSLSGTVLQSPGNGAIKSSPPTVQSQPYGDQPYLSNFQNLWMALPLAS
jgi:hypothetical protein